MVTARLPESAALSDMFQEAARYVAPPQLRVEKGDFDERLTRFRLRQQVDAHPGQVEILQAVWNAFNGLGPKIIWVHTGKRAGKTTTATDLVEEEVENTPEAIFWIISNAYEHSDKIFDAVTETWPAKDKRDKPPKLAQFGPHKKGDLKSKTWDNPKSIEADGVRLLIADECQNLTALAFKKMRPRIVDVGGVMILFGTPAFGDDFFIDMSDQAREQQSWPIEAREYAFVYFHTEMNPLAELQAELADQKGKMDPEEYEELFGGIPSRPSGVIFPEFSLNTHAGRPTLYDDALPVKLWVDPGRHNYAVCVMQFVQGDIYQIDEVYLHDATDAKVIQECASRPWWRQVDELVIDIAAKAKRHEGELSTLDNWQEIGRLTGRCQYVDVEPGTKRLSEFLKDPANGQARLFFNHERCKKTIREFGAYRRGANGKPLDKNNHAIKAITYGLVDHYGLIERRDGARKSRSRSYLQTDHRSSLLNRVRHA